MNDYDTTIIWLAIICIFFCLILLFVCLTIIITIIIYRDCMCNFREIFFNGSQ